MYDLFLIWLIVYIAILVIIALVAVVRGCQKIGIKTNIKILELLCKYGKYLLCCKLIKLVKQIVEDVVSD